jgi:hypothetical protein
MLSRFFGVSAKLLASIAVIGLFFFFSARMPYFHPDRPLSLSSFIPQTGSAPATPMQPSALTLLDDDARFSGDFFDTANNGGFSMREVDVAGPCEGAGERYITSSCTDCVITPAVSDTGEPPTLLWINEAQGQSSMGTIFRDCAATLASGDVRVPVLSFSDDNIDLSGRANTDSDVPVPALADSERKSNMTLGNWAITVDLVAQGKPALEQMGSLLIDAGWSEVQQGATTQKNNQRVFSRGESHLCVVTLNPTDDAYQLVTMMNI